MAKTLVALISALCIAFSAVAAESKPETKKPAQPAWTALSASQQQVLAPIQPEWDQLDTVRRKKWVAIADRYPTMKPASSNGFRAHAGVARSHPTNAEPHERSIRRSASSPRPAEGSKGSAGRNTSSRDTACPARHRDPAWLAPAEFPRNPATPSLAAGARAFGATPRPLVTKRCCSQRSCGALGCSFAASRTSSAQVTYPRLPGLSPRDHYAYFAWQWTHGGQTLPMKTWRMRLTRKRRRRQCADCARALHRGAMRDPRFRRGFPVGAYRP